MGAKQRLWGALSDLLWLVATPIAAIYAASGQRVGLEVIVPPADPGSLGDEALMRGLLGQLGGQPLVDVPYEKGGGWPLLRGAEAPLPALNSLFAAPALARRLGRVTTVRVVGADVLDGYYGVRPSLNRLRLANLGARAGAQTSIVGFSMKEAPPRRVRAAWARIDPRVRVVARDRISADRTSKLLGRPVTAAADLGFLLEHLPDPSLEVEASSRITVGVGVNALLSNAVGGPEAHVARLASCIAELLARDRDIDVLILPHDERGAFSDFDLADRVAQRFTTDRVAATSMRSAVEVRHVLSRLAAVITGRMHVAIGALAEATPVGVLGYQGKAEGTLDLFGLEEWVFDPADVLMNPTTFASIVESLLDRRDEIRGSIEARLPAVVELAKLNIV